MSGLLSKLNNLINPLQTGRRLAKLRDEAGQAKGSYERLLGAIDGRGGEAFLSDEAAGMFAELLNRSGEAASKATQQIAPLEKAQALQYLGLGGSLGLGAGVGGKSLYDYVTAEEEPSRWESFKRSISV